MTTTVKSFAITGAICAFTGFTTAPSIPQELNRSFIVPKEYYLRKRTPIIDECWSKFLGTLRSLDAIVYVPESKRALAERYGIHFDDATASSRNAAIQEQFDKLLSVRPGVENPTSECDGSVRKTFDDLGLIVLVQKSRSQAINSLYQSLLGRTPRTSVPQHKHIGQPKYEDVKRTSDNAHKETIEIESWSLSYVKLQPQNRVRLVDAMDKDLLPASRLSSDLIQK